MEPYYEHKGITIYHGDSVELLPSLANKKPTVLCTDPPFSMAGGISNGMNSSVSDQFFSHWWRTVARLLSSVLAADGSGFIWCDWRTAKIIADGFTPRQSLESHWRVSQMLFHDRQMVGLGAPFRNSVDMLAYVRGPAHKTPDIPKATRNLLSVHWYYGTHPHHPAEKSVEVAVQLLKWCNAKSEDVVLDPFVGSGTTLLAARELGLTAIGIEMEEEYCEVAAKRLSQEVMHL